ncbi:MAG: cation:proton antiporter, partial [Rikenellaceae bacterium]
GTTLDLEFVSKAGVAVVALVFFAMIFRMIGVAASTTKTKLTINEQLFCMIAYIPKATVQAAIGSLPLAMGLPCGKIVLTVAVLAILITAPLGALGIDLTYKKLLSASSNLHYKEPIPTDNIEEELEK